MTRLARLGGAGGAGFARAPAGLLGRCGDAGAHLLQRVFGQGIGGHERQPRSARILMGAARLDMGFARPINEMEDLQFPEEVNK